MPIDAAYVRSVAPEFTDERYSERITFWLAEAARHVSEGDYGARADLAAALWVAHYLKLGDMEGSGAVTAERLGDLARNYAAPGQGHGAYGLTSYGQQFAAIRRLGVGPMVI